ncbi:MAG: fumarylacetoacetate hydrolase family protein [Bacteroidales bacterium]|jgi:acylpyruvate hydrolase|nr:fumarylacetoacetate hydrolase family protein [Bacteroidales bacterium]MDI9593371.1 fumarylacetoacetate hydrolase family protein [Bacteroidota bacterium]OQC38455.1 MAG: Fumarylpyruvate hydrolase [Bacteroidetes bacterium ADurb.Bin041]MBP7875294.1 fumarylacetoacetate hydrolase family protein [Bacteroidales bacterium]MCO6468405.1 fumarylacetoacetate hydrolase family protein [Bacteroidales bacterium]
MKIICIGRNYVEHARELNNQIPEEPVFFLKPDTAIIIRNRPFFYPDFSSKIDYEVELVLKIKKNGRHILPEFAHTYYDEIGIGIDFTARDMQESLKTKGLPWEKAKAFDGSAPISSFVNISKFNDLNDIPFSLKKNGETVQLGNSGLMIFDFNTILVHISKYITIKMGDLIFTGTPAGVGPVAIGDRLEGFLGEEKMLKVDIK